MNAVHYIVPAKDIIIQSANLKQTDTMGSKISSDYKVKILLCGAPNTGKNQLFKSLRTNKPTKEVVLANSMNVQLAPRYVTLDEDLVVNLNIWNIEEKHIDSPIKSTYLQGGSGAIFIFSFSDRESWQSIKTWYDLVQQFSPNIPFILLGNGNAEGSQITSDECEFWAKERGGMLMQSDIDANTEGNNGFSRVLLNLANMIVK